RAKTTGGDGKNTAAGSRIEHRPARMKIARNAFEQTQGHRGRRMFAGPESRFGRDDNRTRASFSLLRSVENAQTRADAQRFVSPAFHKMLKPVRPQPFHASAEFTDEVPRCTFGLARNLQQQALLARTSND